MFARLVKLVSKYSLHSAKATPSPQQGSSIRTTPCFLSFFLTSKTNRDKIPSVVFSSVGKYPFLAKFLANL
ncbi:hypothetical protein BAZSYMB_GCONTIG00733_0 [Bathymodiolus azoricus thioautotrophic gill symbiont]|uniref:Uncharacterized protein n=1 Tax=Bathymodiolus azoricus thioautotrophic gill symbiont TaxID=235205 RepID=A0A1H6MQN8_9GAMM|nr:hypothetical protein BAZSYMB_GCONTIG00733_0 [Bathymodiolus azoricus thioautotrophic gill symbiont]SEI01800.1 hypothetical protein BAZSYMA_ACONTIG65244_1 [Bathymodiolus azoricus thioautotrophic gill symbiont]